MKHAAMAMPLFFSMSSLLTAVLKLIHLHIVTAYRTGLTLLLFFTPISCSKWRNMRVPQVYGGGVA